MSRWTPEEDKILSREAVAQSMLSLDPTTPHVAERLV